MIRIFTQKGGQVGALSAHVNKHCDCETSIDEIQERVDLIDVSSLDLCFFSPGVISEEIRKNSKAILEKMVGTVPIVATGAGSLILAEFFGFALEPSVELLAGRTGRMVHDQQGCFKGLPTPITIARYDTFTIEETSISDGFEISGHSFEGEILALRSDDLKIDLLTMHPHSTATQKGEDILSNCIQNVRKKVIP